ELYFNAKVRSLCYASAATLAATSEKTLKGATTAAKYITKLTEYVFHIHSATAKTTSGGTSMTELVISLFFFRIAEYFVCLSGFLKFFFCFGIIRVFVGVILDRQFPVSRLYFRLVGITRHTQNIVII